MDRAPAITAITSHTTASQSPLSVVLHTSITLTPTLHVSASATSQVTSMDMPASTIVSEELISLRILVTKSVVAISSSSTINMETQTIQTTPLVTSFQVDTSLISVATTVLISSDASSSSVAAAIPLSSVYVDASPTRVAAAISTSSVHSDASPMPEAAAISTSSLYFDSTPVLSISVTGRQGIPFYVSLGVVCLLLVLICAIVIALLAFYWSQKKSKLEMNKTAPDSEMHFNTNMMYESANPTNVEHVYDEPDTRTPRQPRFKLMTNTSESAHTISAYAVTAIPKPAIENTSSVH